MCANKGSSYQCDDALWIACSSQQLLKPKRASGDGFCIQVKLRSEISSQNYDLHSPSIFFAGCALCMRQIHLL
jgi:hypothetical protein